ncbi:MAG: hypothetical protein MJ212_00610 [Alphaproteobacteria bacterium]|nr:hypothetical protein [Alphaproteobacteria bacterium]
MRKRIDLRRINEHCANLKIMDEVQKCGYENVPEAPISLVKVALEYKPLDNPETTKKKAKRAFYAFYKPIGKKKAGLYNIETNKVEIVSVASISKIDEVKKTFTIGGVTYGPKDTVNGLRRFGRYK